jgi:drug/metabolite transporter (DMT)-like permease
VKSTRIILLTLAAMICFAANSLLCRLALKRTTIDPATFTSVRVIAGAAALYLILKMRGKPSRNAGSWISALALFAYAAAFSFAYLTLAAGTGALLLFAAVQATMIAWGFHRGERFGIRQCTGLIFALTGLLVLLFPGISAPSPGRATLMLGAGVAWGVYSLRGNGDPVGATTGNFLRAVPLTLLLSLTVLPMARLDRTGVEYAIASGAITSGLGYVIWYAALRGLNAMSAATVQLSVPVLTAAGGILFLGEPATWRFVISAVAILGGIALVLVRSRED